MIYVLIFFYTILVSYVYSKRKKSVSSKLTKTKLNNAVKFIIMVVPCVAVAGFRYGISVDYTKVYERGFDLIINNRKSEFEMGFSALVKMCGLLIKEAWFMFLIVSLITIVIYFKAFEFSKSYFLSTILFFGVGIYFDTFNGIRQYIVCAVFLYCFKYIREGDWKKYFLIMISCTLIHTSAFFTLPLYFLRNVKINKIYCMIITAMLFVFNDKIYAIVLAIISSIPKYSAYIIRDTISSQISLSVSGITMAIVALIPCILVEEELFKTVQGRYYYNLMMVGLLVAVSTSFLPFAERILYYTRTGILLAIPYALNKMNGKNKTIIQLITVVGMCVLNFLGIYLLNWYAVLPYVSIFSK